MALWDDQVIVCHQMELEDYLLVLKARQLGLTWLCVWELLWRMLRFPGLQAGVYSLREEEAVAVLVRLKEIYRRVGPSWRVRGMGDPVIDNNNHWRLANGSAVRAFSGRSGDSYTFGYVLVDEADLLEDLGRVLRSAEPTLSGGGQMRLVSRADKDKPHSLFKSMYRAARAGRGKWSAVFLPWWARPSRSAEWYQSEVETALATTGNKDFIYEQYPATPEEALAPKESDKRFPMDWVTAAIEDREPLDPRSCPAVQGLEVWEKPAEGVRYFVGADPAEGNPTSDDSALAVLSEDGRQVAQVRGRKQPSQLAADTAVVSAWYNKAPVLPERNNHGHAYILALNTSFPEVPVAAGRDGKPGWLSNQQGNVALYDAMADALRDGLVVVRSRVAADQLQSIRGHDLAAPEGMHDDLADALCLASACREMYPRFAGPSTLPRELPFGGIPVPEVARHQETKPPWWK